MNKRKSVHYTLVYKYKHLLQRTINVAVHKMFHVKHLEQNVNKAGIKKERLASLFLDCLPVLRVLFGQGEKVLVDRYILLDCLNRPCAAGLAIV